MRGSTQPGAAQHPARGRAPDAALHGYGHAARTRRVPVRRAGRPRAIARGLPAHISGGVSIMGVTEEFCRSLRGIEYAALPAEAVRAARRVMLDGIAVAVAGTRERAPHILADHLRELGGAEQATAINFGLRTSAVNAAYLNGASMHVLDYEPMWDP